MEEKKKKSQAELAVSASNKKKKQPEGKKMHPNTDKSVKVENTDKAEAKERQIPLRFITSCAFLAGFLLFLIISFKPEGFVVRHLERVLHGMVGKVGFVVSIPALLYLFYIHAFSGKRPVIMRTICVVVFVVLCGSIAHLFYDCGNLGVGFDFVSNLYRGGYEGWSGGLLCGCITELFVKLFNNIISGIVFFVAAVFTLLGAMQITVPSIIRAVKNRPRAEWENEEQERQEPAAVVVNHLANKRIEYVEKKRTKAAEQSNEQNVDEPVRPKKKESISERIDIPVDDEPAPKEEEDAGKANDFSEADIVFPPKPEKEVPLPSVSAVVEEFEELAAEKPQKAAKNKKVTQQEAEESAEEIAEEISQADAVEHPEYCFPPIDLLKLPDSGFADGTAEMRENSKRLNDTLASFKIDAHITSVTRGPSVTRYEVELEKGVRLGKITSAADDIALSLGASGVRIAAVPGKISIVGIEVPNKTVNTVSLREVIDSAEFNKAKSKSSFAVGKDIGGTCIVGNIAKLPHMLIAGTTGSGKSVCMNSIIISLLYKASPDDVKLIMIDPKMVELGIYNGIPHLLIPVVTDPKKAAGSLQWAVSEMMRRYKTMSDLGVRDIDSYNSIIVHEEDGKKLPQIVVIIDELADLMLVAAKEVEESICRIAQMGRASGIHLLIATQRPSADVITGLMKANIPSRIAFAVASAMESRIILDTQGAEKLVGKGDMLFAPIGCGKPLRVQGCFVSDPEVEAVATYVKSNFNPDYDQDVLEEIERKAVVSDDSKGASAKPAPSTEEMACDEMLPAAVDVFMETGQASVSMLQRRLKLGYARAARIVDEMEEMGLVGKYQGSKPRDMLVTKEQWEIMKEQGNFQMNFQDYLDDQDDEEE